MASLFTRWLVSRDRFPAIPKYTWVETKALWPRIVMIDHILDSMIGFGFYMQKSTWTLFSHIYLRDLMSTPRHRLHCGMA